MLNRKENNKAEDKGCKAEDKDCKAEDKNGNYLYKKCIHNIRNMDPLDEEMISNIHNMSNEEKMNIIISFNEMIKYIETLFANSAF